MKYYILKPKSVAIDEQLLAGIKESDRDAEFVDVIDDCDIAVAQKGWTRSKTAVMEWRRQTEMHRQCQEGSIYLDRCAVHLN